jgi:3-oxoacyl-[acyl-carrier protein] reductase
MNQTIFLTGCSRGIGLALTKEFLRSNNTVYGLSRTRPKIFDEKFTFLECDLVCPNSLENVLTSASLKTVPFDVIINCAGVSHTSLMLFDNYGDIEKVFDVNFHAAVSVMRNLGKGLMRRRRGVVINISSVLVNMHLPGGLAYTASKAALNEATKIMAQEMYKSNVRVYGINMAPFQSSMLDSQDVKFVQSIFERMSIDKPIDIDHLFPWIQSLIDTDSMLFTGSVFDAGLIR